MDSETSKSAHLRLCQLKHWPNFSGYGFKLHLSQVIPGQFIVAHVDAHSPAAAAGLLPGDHIIQVTYGFKEFLKANIKKIFFDRVASILRLCAEQFH